MYAIFNYMANAKQRFALKAALHFKCGIFG